MQKANLGLLTAARILTLNRLEWANEIVELAKQHPEKPEDAMEIPSFTGMNARHPYFPGPLVFNFLAAKYMSNTGKGDGAQFEQEFNRRFLEVLKRLPRVPKRGAPPPPPGVGKQKAGSFE